MAGNARCWCCWCCWSAGLCLSVDGFYPGFGGFLALTENFLPFGLVALGLDHGDPDRRHRPFGRRHCRLSAIVMAELWSGLHVSIWLAAVAGLLAGGVLGAINGLIITRLRTEPLIATLATSFIYASIATATRRPSPPAGFPDAFNLIGTGTLIGPIPLQLVLFRRARPAVHAAAAIQHLRPAHRHGRLQQRGSAL